MRSNVGDMHRKDPRICDNYGREVSVHEVDDQRVKGQ